MGEHMTKQISKERPDWAFICTAGLGTRMMPLTKNVPKPLVMLHNQTLLDHIIDHLLTAGITDIVLNSHYLAHALEEWAKRRAALTPALNLTIYHEEELLDTGGGLARILREEPDRQTPFFMINGDAFWVNESDKNQTLDQMIDQWQSEDASLLLLLEHVDNMLLTGGVGDYALLDYGKPQRQADRSGAYMFAGVRIVAPKFIRSSGFYGDHIYSFLKHMDEAEAANRLSGHIHHGQWHHISTPQDVETVKNSLIDSFVKMCTSSKTEAI
jgi:NDP-sugar pyrophosphorylase family protein